MQLLLVNLDFAEHECEKNKLLQSSKYKENSFYFTYIKALKKTIWITF